MQGLSYVLGFSHTVQRNLVNLSDGVNNRIAYAAAHTVVILDNTTRKQQFLQGHKSSITCIAANHDHSIIASADSGPESMMVLWDSSNGQPIRIVNDLHSYGVCAMEISDDGKYMATISAVNPETGAQEVALWDFRQARQAGPMQPLVSGAVPAGKQTAARL